MVLHPSSRIAHTPGSVMMSTFLSRFLSGPLSTGIICVSSTAMFADALGTDLCASVSIASCKAEINSLGLIFLGMSFTSLASRSTQANASSFVNWMSSCSTACLATAIAPGVPFVSRSLSIFFLSAFSSCGISWMNCLHCRQNTRDVLLLEPLKSVTSCVHVDGSFCSISSFFDFSCFPHFLHVFTSTYALDPLLENSLHPPGQPAASLFRPCFSASAKMSSALNHAVFGFGFN